MQKLIECPCCDGTGVSETTNCCDAPYDKDIMLCTECYEHIGEQECDECNGKGTILNHIDTKEDY